MSQSGSYRIGTGLPPIETITGNAGGAVGPDGVGNLTLVGSTVLSVTGVPASNTLTIALSNGTNGQLLIGGGSAAAWASLTSSGGTITVTPGANTLNIETGGGIAASFPTDLGTATPALGVLTVSGGTNVNTAGAGSTVTINLDTALTAIDSITTSTGGSLRTGTTDTNTTLLQAYDVDGAAYVTFATLTAANTPTMDLDDAVTKSGAYIYRAGGTAVATTDGGTGLSVGPTNGQLLIGNGGIYTLNTLNSSDSTITITNGGGTIDLITGAAVATSYTTDAGSAVPAAGVLTVAGGTNINTAGAASTVTINLDTALTAIDSITMSTGGSFRTGTTATNTALIQAYDVDGAVYTTFATLTAANDPTMDLDDAVTKAGQYIYRAGGTDVPVTDGGTGASTLLDHGVLVGSGTAAITALAVGTDGQVLLGSSAADPVFATLASAGSTIAFTTGAGSLNLETGSSVAISFPTDGGTATPSTGALTVAGGTNITTAGAAATVTINLDSALASIDTITLNAGGSLRTATGAGNTALLQAYDVDGASYVTFATLTANNDPTMDLDDAVTKGGGYIYRAGGTDVPVTDGGTGASTLLDHGVLVGSGTGAITPLAVGTDGQVLLGSSAADPVFATLTSSGGTITFTPGAGTLNLETAGGVATTYATDSGNAAPAAGTITIAGGTNINTAGAGSTVTINLDDVIYLPSTNAAGTAGIIYINSNRFMHAYLGNTFLGINAGNLTTTGTSNVGIGASALLSLTTGSSNVAVGALALDALTSGASSIGIGHNAGTALTTDSSNVLIGYYAGSTLTSASSCIALGGSSLSPSGGTAGTSNIAIGINSMSGTAVGSNNIAVGNSTLLAINGSNYNTAIGSGSCTAVTTGNNNTGCGYSTLSTLTTGAGNTALGYSAGSALATGDSNNICINNNGVATDSGIMRIGVSGTLNKSFIAGIYNVTPDVGTYEPVIIDSAGQLGTLDQLDVAHGGTGATTLTDHSVLVGSGTGAITPLAVGTDGQVLLGSTGADPVFATVTSSGSSITLTPGAGSLNLDLSGTIGGNYIYRATGTDIPVTDGGTGVSSLTDHGVLVGSGTAAVTPLAVGTDGQVLLGSTGADPVFATLASAGSTIAFTPGAGTLNLETGTAVATSFPTDSGTATPSSGALTVTGGTNIGTTGAAAAVTVNLDSALTAIDSITTSTGGSIRTATSAGNTTLLQAYDVDGAAYTTFATLTANNDPTMDLDDAVTKGGQYIYRAGGTDVPVTDGGTGVSSFTAYAVVCGGTTGTAALQSIASVGSANQVLTSNGAGALPTFQDVSAGGITWNNSTSTPVSMAVENGYVANNAGLLTFTLPSTASVGERVAVAGSNANGWKIAQNAGQTIHFGNQDTTTGATGYLQFTNQYDCVELICVTANTDWVVRSSVGNITVA